jgi:hypothetical protein
MSAVEPNETLLQERTAAVRRADRAAAAAAAELQRLRELPPADALTELLGSYDESTAAAAVRRANRAAAAAAAELQRLRDLPHAVALTELLTSLRGEHSSSRHIARQLQLNKTAKREKIAYQ